MFDDFSDKFCLGNICYDIDPPKKISKQLYRCDNKFHIDELYEQIRVYDGYGIILLSGDITKFYLVEGCDQKLLGTIECNIKGKHGRGGQSQQRFERLRLEDINEYHKKIHEKLKLYFIDKESNLPNIKGVIFAGPAKTKNFVADHDAFDYRLKNILIRMETTGELRENTIIEVIKKIDDIINSENDEIKNIVNRFIESVIIDDGFAIYGQSEIFNCLEQKLLNYLIVTDNYYLINKNKIDLYQGSNGCKLVITKSQLVETYGGIVGLYWYPLELENQNNN